jgi:hypothetical protein
MSLIKIVDGVEIPLSEAETAERAAEEEAWEAGATARHNAEMERLRAEAYRNESDPIFFKWQRNENQLTKQAWLDKVDEIKERHPDIG